MPLTLQERVVGVLDLEGSAGGADTSAEQELAVSLANQAALAIDNLQLLEEARKLAALPGNRPIEDRASLGRLPRAQDSVELDQGLLNAFAEQ